MHLHGVGHQHRYHSRWPGILALTVMIVMTAIHIGWLALAPFVFAAFILGVARWFMRAIV